MLELLAYAVLFWVIMPALLLGIGKLIVLYTTVTPRSGGVLSRQKTSAFKDLLASRGE